MIVRKAEQKDARIIAQISVDTWKDAYKGLIADDVLNARKVDEKRVSNWIENIQNPAYIVLVCEDKEVLGYLWAGPARDDRNLKNELYALYVKTSAQRRGIGGELISKYRQMINNEGFYLYMIKNNSKASAFYEKTGGSVCEQYNRKFEVKNQTIEEVCYIF